MLRVCGSIESLRIPFDANAFRETQKEKDERIETVNGEQGSSGVSWIVTQRVNATK